MEEDIKVSEKLKVFSCGKRCSDYDDECVDVIDPVGCFMGCSVLGIADGYCPMIHIEN